MKKFLLTLLCAGVLFGLPACSGVFDNDYLAVTAHDEQYTIDEGSDALTAENYLGLKNAILSFVENHVEYGVIRIYSYDGDVESDLADAAYEVAKSDPLGAYAVDYMTHDCTLIVSYYEIHIYITFARTQAEVDAVVRVNSIAALREQFEQALLNGSETLTLRISSYAEQDFLTLAQESYEANPTSFAELPEITVELYPSSGVQRILQFEFLYEHDAAERASRVAALQEQVAALTGGLDALSDPSERFDLLCERLLAHMNGAELQEDAIFYDALCGGAVSSASIAKVLTTLAGELDLTCITVDGRRNNVPYEWNVVTIGDNSFHVDLLRDLMAGSGRATRYGDADLAEEYAWDTETVPVCEIAGEQIGSTEVFLPGDGEEAPAGDSTQSEQPEQTPDEQLPSDEQPADETDPAEEEPLPDAEQNPEEPPVEDGQTATEPPAEPVQTE